MENDYALLQMQKNPLTQLYLTTKVGFKLLSRWKWLGYDGDDGIVRYCNLIVAIFVIEN